MNREDCAVLLDANVLLQPRLADALLDMHGLKLCDVHFTQEIVDEVVRNGERIGGKREHWLNRMEAVKRFVRAWEVRLDSEDFSIVPKAVDEKDRHVAAAAIALRRYAEGRVFLVSDNVRHLAAAQMADHGVEVLTAGAFLDIAYAEAPDGMLAAVNITLTNHKNPSVSVDTMARRLRDAGASRLAKAVERAFGRGS